jgi:N-acetylglucosaminyldiphosphoundecaprenol N-acetyl-beta-D-mannosaminyltransferase
MVMEAWDDSVFRATVNRADLVLADGQPMVWALRLLGVPQRRRVRVTPDLLLRLFAEGERHGWAVGLYGGSDETLPIFRAVLAERFPRLQVAFAYAPPFRLLTAEEDEAVVERLRSADVKLLLVGLGCPKQERWMAGHRERLSCVMMGVGAAFDLFGGRTTEAPRWTRDIGLEWAWRLSQDPRRLWRRHAKHDVRFIGLMMGQAARRVGEWCSPNDR